jgi:hypothetical protein
MQRLFQSRWMWRSLAALRIGSSIPVLENPEIQGGFHRLEKIAQFTSL